MNDCPHCAEKDERIAWLEGELGLQRSSGEIDALYRAFPMAPGKHSCTGRAFDTILVLYHAKGRVVSRLQIMDAIPPKNGGDDERTAQSVSVWVLRARKMLGRDAIHSVWGRGYRLSDEAMIRVQAVLDA